MGTEEPFYVGFAISVYQNSGDGQAPSNWGAWERSRTAFGFRTIAGGGRCRESCDFWNRFEEDLERAAALGSNCFRLSLEWARLEPQQGCIDQETVQRYKEILDCLERRGMEPFVTLHHFVHPLWFEKLGGFRKEENISYFVSYAQTAFKLFGKRVTKWATFNEPGVFTGGGFMQGSFPPGRVADMSGCGRHLLHVLRAHTQAYAAIKAMPGGASSQVGIVWNWFWFEPKRNTSCTPPYLPFICRVLNRAWGNDPFMHYLQTGEFDWCPLPWVTSRVQYSEPNGKPGCDYIGVNYYSRAVLDWKLAATCNTGQIMTEMPYALYAEGLLLAIHHANKLGVPIYITETGIAEKGDALRPEMIQTYMQQVEHAVQLGYNLRGIMYWSLTDCFEWADGFKVRFGVFQWEQDGKQQRTMRKSAALLGHWFKHLPARVAALWQQQAGGAAVSAEVDVAKQPLALAES